MSTSAPRRHHAVVTFLLTDIAGSTRLWDRYPEAMTRALARHDAIIGEAVHAHGGDLVKVKGEGDSTFSVFGSPADAVAAAWSAQVALTQEEWGVSGGLWVRMAIYTGEVVARDGDYFGTTVNRAARLRAIAAGGEVLVGGTSADLVVDRLPSDLELTDLGLHHLRDLDRPERVFRLDRRRAAADPAHRGREEGAIPLPARFRRPEGLGLVGRGVELTQLASACAATFDDALRRALFVTGEAGIGKTRICAELGRRVHADGAVVLAGRCTERLGTPFAPFSQALGHLVRHARRELVESHIAAHQDELGRVVPELIDRIPTVATSPIAGAETERYLVYRAVVDLLNAAAADRGLLLILDDLHWADSASVGLLSHLLTTDPLERVVIVGTYRDTDVSADSELGGLLADAWAEPGVDRLRLAGLDRTEILELMENAAGASLGAAGHALGLALENETAGNPFLLGEMLRSLREAGAVDQAADGTWTLGSSHDLSSIALPDSVHDVVRRRVGRLSSAAQQLLGVAAVIGTEFDPTLLSAVAEVDEVQTHDLLERAAAAAIVHDMGPARGFAFAHAIIRRTLVEDLSRHRRERLHVAIAKQLEASSVPSATTIAAHVVAGGEASEPRWASAVARRAGDEALTNLAAADAVRWYRAALDLDPGADQRDRLELEIQLGRAQRQSGDRAYRRTLLAAARCAQDMDEHGLLIAAVLANDRRHGSLTGGVDRERVEMLRTAIVVAGDDDRTRARLLGTLASELTFDSDREGTLALADEALTLARRTGDDETLLAVLLARFLTVLAPDRMDEATACSIELFELAQRHDDRAALVFAGIYRAYACLASADIHGFDDAIRIADAAAESMGQPFLRHVMHVIKALQASLRGRYDDAERLAHDAFELGRACGVMEAQAHFMGQLYRVRLAQGRLAELVPTLEAIVRGHPDHPAPQITLCGAYCRLDRRADAEALFVEDAAVEFASLPWDRYSLMGLATYAQVSVYLNARRPAEALYERLRPFADQIAFGESTCMGSVSLYCGLLATMLDDFDAAEGYFVRAESAHLSLESPALVATTRVELARMLLRRARPGDEPRATALIETAIADAGAIAAPGLAEPWRLLGTARSATSSSGS